MGASQLLRVSSQHDLLLGLPSTPKHVVELSIDYHDVETEGERSKVFHFNCLSFRPRESQLPRQGMTVLP